MSLDTYFQGHNQGRGIPAECWLTLTHNTQSHAIFAHCCSVMEIWICWVISHPTVVMAIQTVQKKICWSVWIIITSGVARLYYPGESYYSHYASDFIQLMNTFPMEGRIVLEDPGPKDTLQIHHCVRFIHGFNFIDLISRSGTEFPHWVMEVAWKHPWYPWWQKVEWDKVSREKLGYTSYIWNVCVSFYCIFFSPWGYKTLFWIVIRTLGIFIYTSLHQRSVNACVLAWILWRLVYF